MMVERRATSFSLVCDYRIRKLSGMAFALGESLHSHFCDSVIMNECCCDHQDVEQLMAVELQ